MNTQQELKKLREKYVRLFKYSLYCSRDESKKTRKELQLIVAEMLYLKDDSREEVMRMIPEPLFMYQRNLN